MHRQMITRRSKEESNPSVGEDLNASRKGVLEKGSWEARAWQAHQLSETASSAPVLDLAPSQKAWTAPGAQTRPSPRLPPNPTTYHRELAVSEPHDPAGAFSCSAPARHPPRHNAAWPPGEAPKFPPHQLPNAKAPAVLEPQGAEVITWWSRGPATLIPPWQPQPWASEGQDSQEGAPSERTETEQDWGDEEAWGQVERGEQDGKSWQWKDPGKSWTRQVKKRAAHLVLWLIIGRFGGVLIPGVGSHRLRRGGHSGGRGVSGLLHRGRAGLLHLLRLARPLVFFHSVHYCNHLGFLLSLEKQR